jgi:hypothetical protein
VELVPRLLGLQEQQFQQRDLAERNWNPGDRVPVDTMTLALDGLMMGEWVSPSP